MQSLRQRGLPLSLSRWTDVAHWYRPWLRDLIARQGFLFAPDPEDGLVKKWSLDPDEVHALFFWTKNPHALVSPLVTWLSPYRVYTAVTITGWDDEEPRAPSFSDQITGLKDLVVQQGRDRVTVRYSPIPTDLLSNPNRYDRWRFLLDVVSDFGLYLDVSLLHGDRVYDGGRLDVLRTILADCDGKDIRPGFCGSDAQMLDQAGITFRSTQCVSRDRLFDAHNVKSSLKNEPSCDCSLSVDPCLGPKFGCGSKCSYCYAPYTITRGI